MSLSDSTGGISNAVSSLDLQDPDADWGRPEVGRTHVLSGSMVYMAPSLQDSSPMVRRIFGDWEINAIVGAASGQPLDIFVTGSLPILQTGPSGTGNWQNLPAHERPNRTSESCSPSGAAKEQILNPAAYTVNGFQLGTIGTGRRGDCTGPGYFQTDLSFYKNIPISDRIKFQFRWDIFNFFNNTNFLSGANSNFNNVLSPSNITLNSSNPATATAITTATTPANFGRATRTRDPRQMQFGFKILW
jgi:hypothetical protein